MNMGWMHKWERIWQCLPLGRWLAVLLSFLLRSYVSYFCVSVLSVSGLVITSSFSLNFVSSLWISLSVHSWLSNKLFPIFSSLPLQTHHHHPTPTPPPLLASISVMQMVVRVRLLLVIRLFKVALSSWRRANKDRKKKERKKKTSIKLSQHQSCNVQLSKVITWGFMLLSYVILVSLYLSSYLPDNVFSLRHIT